MKTRLSIFIITLALGNLFACAKNCDNELNEAKKAYILSKFCTEVKYNFALYDKLAFDWDSLCLAEMPKLTNTTTDDEFVKGMQKLCNTLRDGHTSVFAMDNPKDKANWIRPFPMTTKRVGNKVFVTAVYDSVLRNKGVCENCEVLSIDGENVLDYGYNHIRPYLHSSTPQWSDYRPFSDFELTKEKGSKVSKIEFLNPDGKRVTVVSDRNFKWDLQTSAPMLKFKILENNVGLLTVGSFLNGDFDRTLFDKLYNEILKTDALIIDIRCNAGGNSSHADYLISHFSDKPIEMGSWKSPMYIAAHGSWRLPKEWYMQKPHPIMPAYKKKIYDKPIALLVNATTFSSAENLCVTFRSSKRGKIIGTPTGGSTGNPIMIDLGFGIGCCICTKYEWDADGGEFIMKGIQPDIVVEEDAEAYAKGKDNVVDKAIEVLLSKYK